jgi:hypothetical protein
MVLIVSIFTQFSDLNENLFTKKCFCSLPPNFRQFCLSRSSFSCGSDDTIAVLASSITVGSLFISIGLCVGICCFSVRWNRNRKFQQLIGDLKGKTLQDIQIYERLGFFSFFLFYYYINIILFDFCILFRLTFLLGILN